MFLPRMSGMMTEELEKVDGVKWVLGLNALKGTALPGEWCRLSYRDPGG